ncbi:btk-binding protein-related [Anaeramoeba flamelloides]|uniref:Btk-binding protein-related n=1 Tax=Anaeramoeba flamelloides TaxID=1746091 RepID=A0AAV8A218_9EUKA|nr:btk-binding protein-related [Anaeramoeba flamelloides]
MEKDFRIFINPCTTYQFLTDQKDNKTQMWAPITKIQDHQRIEKMVIGYKPHCLVKLSNASNKLELYSELTKYEYTLKDENITELRSGMNNYLILCESGRVYSLANTNSYFDIPFTDFKQSSHKNPRLVTFFTEKKLFVEQIMMGSGSNYYLCKGNQLYGNGYNIDGSLGNGEKVNKQMPIFIRNDVSKVYAGPHALGYFYSTVKSKELFGCGQNSNGQLGIGDKNPGNNYSPVKVALQKLNLDASDIKDLVLCAIASCFITNDGKTYSCGSSSQNGHTIAKKEFTELYKLKNINIVKICGGQNHMLALTEQNELYGWGFQISNLPTKQQTAINTPTKLIIPQVFIENSLNLGFCCGSAVAIIYPNSELCILEEDFKLFFKSKKFCDSQIAISSLQNQDEEELVEIPVHKLLVEFRTKLPLNEIQKRFDKHSFSSKEINRYLEWVYFGQKAFGEKFSPIFNALNLPYPLEDNFKEDLFKLYKDEDSKDFSILVQDDEEQEQDEDKDEDEDEDEDYEEIPVHKLILLARSGLFREMFENINEKQTKNSVKDYSHKTIESLEILIKFLYTGKIELTADDDPQLIVEDLEDAVDYYKLNTNSELKFELNKIRKQFDL